MKTVYFVIILFLFIITGLNFKRNFTIHFIPQLFDFSANPLKELNTENILIIGTQKGGSTLLFHYLRNQPQFYRKVTKEIHYIDKIPYSTGVMFKEYSCSKLSNQKLEIIKQRYFEKLENFVIKYNNNSGFQEKRFIMDATPSYMLYPFTADILNYFNEDFKTIAVLRDPFYRTLSGFNMVLARNAFSFTKSQKTINLSLLFHQQVKKEIEDINSCLELKDTYNSWEEGDRCFTKWQRCMSLRLQREFNYDFNRFKEMGAFVLRSVYVEQLLPFQNLLKQKPLVICSEEFFLNPQQTLGQVLNYLNITHLLKNEDFASLKSKIKVNKGNYSLAENNVLSETKSLLLEFFYPYKLKLFETFNISCPNWL